MLDLWKLYWFQFPISTNGPRILKSNRVNIGNVPLAPLKFASIEHNGVIDRPNRAVRFRISRKRFAETHEASTRESAFSCNAEFVSVQKILSRSCLTFTSIFNPVTVSLASLICCERREVLYTQKFSNDVYDDSFAIGERVIEFTRIYFTILYAVLRAFYTRILRKRLTATRCVTFCSSYSR